MEGIYYKKSPSSLVGSPRKGTHWVTDSEICLPRISLSCLYEPIPVALRRHLTAEVNVQVVVSPWQCSAGCSRTASTWLAHLPLAFYLWQQLCCCPFLLCFLTYLILKFNSFLISCQENLLPYFYPKIVTEAKGVGHKLPKHKSCCLMGRCTGRFNF